MICAPLPLCAMRNAAAAGQGQLQLSFFNDLAADAVHVPPNNAGLLRAAVAPLLQSAGLDVLHQRYNARAGEEHILIGIAAVNA